MKNHPELHTANAEKVEQKPEKTRNGWQRIGDKILGLFRNKPKQNKQIVAPTHDHGQTDGIEKVDTEPSLETRAEAEPDQAEVPSGKFREPETGDESALIREMESYRYRQKDLLQGERAQELSEREFNQQLSLLEELEVASEAEGVSRRSEVYDGREIPVYDLSGYPFRFLQHIVGYKVLAGNGDHTIGYNTARRLLDDPSLWMRQESEIAMDGRAADQEANTLSTSYVDTEIDVRGGASDKHGVAYGFLSVRPDSIIGIYNGDGATSNKAGKNRPSRYNFTFSPDELAKNSTRLYSEVLLRRYDEAGKPKAPDFLVVHHGAITENTKRHAAYFGIPIVNINDEPYLAKQRKRLAARIESVGSESSYDEIFRVFQELDQSSLGVHELWKEDIYKDFGENIEQVYRGRLGALPEQVRPKLQDLVERIEPAKRLEMLDQELSRVTAELAKAEDRLAKYQVDDPFFIGRRTRRDRRLNGRGLDYDPSTFVDSLLIQYSYKIGNGKVRQLKTIMDETDAAYEHFSRLVDEYEASGGDVWDDRVDKHA